MASNDTREYITDGPFDIEICQALLQWTLDNTMSSMAHTDAKRLCQTLLQWTLDNTMSSMAHTDAKGCVKHGPTRNWF